MTVMTQAVLSSSLRRRFELVHVDTSDHREIGNVGRFDLTNVVLALKAVVSFARTVRRPDVSLIYLPIAKHRLAFLRDALFLLAARVSRRPTVVHLHARGFADFRRSQPVWMRLVIHICFGGDKVHAIVLGRQLRNEFHGLVPDRQVHVLPNGVADLRTATARPAESRAVPTVLYLSTLWSEKGLFEFLRSAAQLRSQNPALRFLLAGEWYSRTEAEDARRFIETHGLSEHLRCTGPVRGDMKRRVFSDSTVLVLPSRSEGHPLVILEALSAGVPVVATRVGAIPETIQDGAEGFLVDVGDIEGMTERIAEIVGDPALRARMSHCARVRYEREFGIEQFAERLGAIWKTAAHSSDDHPAPRDAGCVAR